MDQYSSAARSKISKPTTRFACKDSGSIGSPVSIRDNNLTSAPRTPLARYAQYESTEIRSSRASNKRISLSFDSWYSIQWKEHTPFGIRKKPHAFTPGTSLSLREGFPKSLPPDLADASRFQQKSLNRL